MKRVPPERAFTLVEVTLALGIAVFCLVVVFGLMNVGINTSSASIEQTTATNILSMVASDLRAAPTPSLKPNAPPATDGTYVAGAPSAIYGLTLPTNGSAAPATVTKTLDASGQPVTAGVPPRYQLDVYSTPGADKTRNPTIVRLVVSWPPSNSTVKSGTVEAVVALDRN